MKRLAKVLLCGLLLTAVEYVILFLCFYAQDVIKSSVSRASLPDAFRAANEVIAVRFIFYFAVWVGLMYPFYEMVKRPTLRLAVTNCGLYIGISVLITGFIPGAADYFTYSFFFFLVAATFISPFVLRLLPYVKKAAFCAGLLLIGTAAFSQTTAYPSWLKAGMKKKGLDAQYELSSFLKPAFLQDDFTGDGVKDIAVLVVEKTTQKKGILLLPGRSSKHYVFGAGASFGNGSDDFAWADTWSVYKEKSAYATQFDKKSGDVKGGKQVQISRHCIYIASREDATGGLIYWTGTKYRWIHQGE